jgi:hypothetical protein
MFESIGPLYDLLQHFTNHCLRLDTRLLTTRHYSTLPGAKSKSKSHCDWRSVSQSVLISSPHLGLMTRYLLLFDSYSLVIVGRPLWWEDSSSSSWSRAEQSSSLLPATSQHGHSWYRAPLGPMAKYLFSVKNFVFLFFFHCSPFDIREGLGFFIIGVPLLHLISSFTELLQSRALAYCRQPASTVTLDLPGARVNHCYVALGLTSQKTRPLPGNGRPIVACMWVAGNVFTDPLPNNGYTRHNIVTDLINALPDNVNVNTVQHATIVEAVFSMSSAPGSSGITGLCNPFLSNGPVNTLPRKRWRQQQ